MNRFVELLLVVLLSPLWIPLFLVITVLLFVFQGPVVFFTDCRAGLGSRPFRLLKFRTMNPGDGADCERITRIGRFLRRSSLDEIPELFNVLAGDMALVGPRPLPVRYLPRYTPEEARRHDVRPGITGWAQVNGRNSISWEEKFALDLEYIARRSLFFDLKILVMTIARVLSAKGINKSGSETMDEFRG